MRREDCFYLGKIVSRHGYKGDLLVKLDTDDPREYENMESVFVSLGNNLVPFFISKSRLHKSNLLRVTFEDATTEEAVSQLMGSELYLPLDQLPKLTGNRFYYHEVIGFRLEDETHGNAGIIKEVNDQAAQALFVAEKDGREVLIPVSDDYIVSVDRENRTIHIRTPEGLLDLYLGG